MPNPDGYISRARLIASMLATGALAACGGQVRPSAFQLLPDRESETRGLGSTSNAERYVNEIFAHDAFKGLDTKKLLKLFDPSPRIDANQRAYFKQTGRLVQRSTVIGSIPGEGIVIKKPGTYTLGHNVSWTPKGTATSAISIRSDDVTLDLAGFSIKAAIADKTDQVAGILVDGPAANITIMNGTVKGVTEYGILAKNVSRLTISNVTVSGICMRNLAIRNLTPSGIWVGYSDDVVVSNCRVLNSNVKTDSSAGIQLISTSQSKVVRCSVNSLVNNDGAVQGFSHIGCTAGTISECTANSLVSHFDGNVLATGHTVLGLCPIFCQNLTYTDCTATNCIGCCDDCHGMSVFLDGQITVKRFRANHIVDGAGPEHTGAKATGLEVMGVGVTIEDCVAMDVKAINPQDLQAAAFSAWGLLNSFTGCSAVNVTVEDKKRKSLGVGFGYAPDPRHILCDVPAALTSYTNCKAESCDVAFDTWSHVDSTWKGTTYTNCGTGYLVQPGATRTWTCDGCSECVPDFSNTLPNMASGNTYPH